MKRHRKIAAAPQRTSTECWQAIGELIRTSLEPSRHVSSTEVEETLAAAAGVGRQLVAGGHLDSTEHPITVVAADLHLCLNTVSGPRALTLEENLNLVVGAASAEEWTIYLPTPDPLNVVVRGVAAADDHLSADAPPKVGITQAGKAEAEVVDVGALEEWARRGR